MKFISSYETLLTWLTNNKFIILENQRVSINCIRILTHPKCIFCIYNNGTVVVQSNPADSTIELIESFIGNLDNTIEKKISPKGQCKSKQNKNFDDLDYLDDLNTANKDNYPQATEDELQTFPILFLSPRK